jgi:hypothetical protein
VLLEIIQIFALGPVIRVGIEVTQIHSVRLLPIGELDFHGLKKARGRMEREPMFLRSNAQRHVGKRRILSFVPAGV